MSRSQKLYVLVSAVMFGPMIWLQHFIAKMIFGTPKPPLLIALAIAVATGLGIGAIWMLSLKYLHKREERRVAQDGEVR